MSDSPLTAAVVRRALAKQFKQSRETPTKVKGLKNFTQGFHVAASAADSMVEVIDRRTSMARSDASLVASNERLDTYATHLEGLGYWVVRSESGHPRRTKLIVGRNPGPEQED